LPAEGQLPWLLSLQSVSVNAARLPGVDDHLGQIRRSFTAGFVAVAAGSIDDLAAMQTISLVVPGGRVIREDAA
jgi:imidazolonepropionase-like amidohydrolase